MALTIVPSSIYPNDVWGAVEVRFVNCTPAAADYATGGYTLTPGQGISLAVIYIVDYIGGLGGYTPVWNLTTQKLQVFQSAAALGPATEVPAATDLSGFTFQLVLIGR